MQDFLELVKAVCASGSCEYQSTRLTLGSDLIKRQRGGL